MKRGAFFICLITTILIFFSNVWSESYPITWDGQELKRTIGIGGIRELRATFTSRIKLNDVDLWIVPELQSFARLHQPHFDTVDANTPQEITVRLYIPQGTQPGLYEGTLHIKVGPKTYPRVLKIEISVVDVLDAETIRSEIVNDLITGDLSNALMGFKQNEKSQTLIPNLDVTQRNQLAFWIQNAELVKERGNSRIYRYTWTEESGEHFVEFSMTKDPTGQWIITTW